MCVVFFKKRDFSYHKNVALYVKQERTIHWSACGKILPRQWFTHNKTSRRNARSQLEKMGLGPRFCFRDSMLLYIRTIEHVALRSSRIIDLFIVAPRTKSKRDMRTLPQLTAVDRRRFFEMMVISVSGSKRFVMYKRSCLTILMKNSACLLSFPFSDLLKSILECSHCANHFKPPSDARSCFPCNAK